MHYGEAIASMLCFTILVVCYGGVFVFPLVCSAPFNGQINCNNGLVDMAIEGNNCTFSCDLGYMLQGSVTSGTCENTGSWSGGLPSCVPLNCTGMLPLGVTIVSPSCGLVWHISHNVLYHVMKALLEMMSLTCVM